jgi:hypothetical protein
VRLNLLGPALAPGLVFAACGEPLAPIVRFELRPAYLCEGVADQEVRLDAGGSLAWDGSVADDLRYAWSFSFEPTSLVAGGLDQESLIALWDGDRPVRVRLEVADAAGVSAAQVETLGLTQARLFDCATGCAEHEVCAGVGGRDVCVDGDTCNSAEDCEPCRLCRPDDDGARRCLP